jgi:hypothetical protein
MNHIILYLEKFAKLAPNNDRIKAAVVQAVKQMTGMKIAEEAVEVRDNEIRVRADSALRAELFVRREMLERLVTEQVPKVRIKKV